MIFKKPYIERDRQFCGHSCATTGENNGMFGNKEAGEKISKKATERILSGGFNIHTGYKSGWFKSKKLGKKMFYRSSYELKALEMLENDETVLFFDTEPFSIEYEFNGCIHNYIPDIIVEYFGRQELIEVKPECLTEKPQNLAKQQAGIDFCKEHGMEYKILTERELEYS